HRAVRHGDPPDQVPEGDRRQRRRDRAARAARDRGRGGVADGLPRLARRRLLLRLRDHSGWRAGQLVRQLATRRCRRGRRADRRGEAEGLARFVLAAVAKRQRRPQEYIPVNWPPVTLMTWPWMKLEKGEQRKRTGPAAPEGSAGRPSGIVSRAICRSCSGIPSETSSALSPAAC